MNNHTNTKTWVLASHPWGEPENGWAFKSDKKWRVLRFESEELALAAMDDDDRYHGAKPLEVDELEIHE